MIMSDSYEKHDIGNVKHDTDKKYWAYGFVYGGFSFLILSFIYFLAIGTKPLVILWVCYSLIVYVVYVIANHSFAGRVIPHKELFLVELLLIISMICYFFADLIDYNR